MESRFEVYRIAPGNLDNLVAVFQSLLTTKGMRSGAPRHVPLETTIHHLISFKPQTVLVQHNVQDPDFLAEHAAYYSKWTYKVPRFCHRLHFFSAEAVSDDPLAVIDQMAAEQNSYLGFVTLRPISVSPQAATILRPSEGGLTHFILSKDEFQVNIAGRQFSLIGTPFIQQDNAVGACAQASIWMALRTLRRREGQSAFSPAQITSAATRFLVRGRTLPNRGGLVVEQITEALRAAGYAPHTIPLRELDKGSTPESLIDTRMALYPYIESGIPTLLLLFPRSGEGHAVLLIGHGWKADPAAVLINTYIDLGNGKRLTVCDASAWAEPFYIHNDNTGPYLPLPDEDASTYALSDAVFAIPFLQPNVFVDASEAKLTSHRLLADSLENLKSHFPSPQPDEFASIPEIVTRTYLQEKAEFREAVLLSDMPDDVKRYYREKWLPKRVWVTEINLLHGYGGSVDKPAVRVGEILLDPSSEPEDGHFLSIHLGADLLPQAGGKNGVLIDRDAFNGAIQGILVSGKRYSPLVR